MLRGASPSVRTFTSLAMPTTSRGDAGVYARRRRGRQRVEAGREAGCRCVSYLLFVGVAAAFLDAVEHAAEALALRLAESAVLSARALVDQRLEVEEPCQVALGLAFGFDQRFFPCPGVAPDPDDVGRRVGLAVCRDGCFGVAGDFVHAPFAQRLVLERRQHELCAVDAGASFSGAPCRPGRFQQVVDCAAAQLHGSGLAVAGVAGGVEPCAHVLDVVVCGVVEVFGPGRY